MMPIDFKLLLPLVIIDIALKIFGLVDLARTEKERIRSGSKLLWVLVILLVNNLGTIVYFIFGKKN
jgi:hypothetical protein